MNLHVENDWVYWWEVDGGETFFTWCDVDEHTNLTFTHNTQFSSMFTQI